MGISVHQTITKKQCLSIYSDTNTVEIYNYQPPNYENGLVSDKIELFVVASDKNI